MLMPAADRAAVGLLRRLALPRNTELPLTVFVASPDTFPFGWQPLAWPQARLPRNERVVATAAAHSGDVWAVWVTAEVPHPWVWLLGASAARPPSSALRLFTTEGSLLAPWQVEIMNGRWMDATPLPTHDASHIACFTHATLDACRPNSLASPPSLLFPIILLPAYPI